MLEDITLMQCMLAPARVVLKVWDELQSVVFRVGANAYELSLTRSQHGMWHNYVSHLDLSRPATSPA